MPRTPTTVSKVSPPRRAAEPGEGADVIPVPRGCSNLKLRQADRVVSRHYDRHLAAVGLKTSQYALLGHIAALMPVQPAVLAARLQMEPSTLTRNLQPLVAQGWVQIGPGRDARSRAVGLTESGLAKHAQAKAAWRGAQLSFNDRLGAQRVALLHTLLDECLQCMAEPGLDETLADPDSTAPGAGGEGGHAGAVDAVSDAERAGDTGNTAEGSAG